MDLREQDVNLMVENEVDEFELNSPEIQAILNRIKQDTNSKKKTVSAESVPVATTTKRSTKRKSADELMKLIADKKADIHRKELEIAAKMKSAQSSLDLAPAEFAKAKEKFESAKHDLLLKFKDENTEMGKKSLIAYYKGEIERLENDLSSGNFSQNGSKEFNTAYAIIIDRYQNRRDKIKRDWIDWAYDIINITVEGNVPADKKKRLGLKEELAKYKEHLAMLEDELKETLEHDKMSSSKKDTGEIMKMANKVMENEDMLDEFADNNIVLSAKKEISSMMAGVSLEDEMDMMLK